MPNVVLVLSLEDQSPICVILPGWTIQLPVYICPLQNATVLIRVNALALQGVVHIIALQGAVRGGTKGSVSPPLTSAKKGHSRGRGRPLLQPPESHSSVPGMMLPRDG
jgi:hypothetical protein